MCLDNHIGNSRDTSFEQMILRETNGRGVDIVLNSLTGDKLEASLRCLRHEGQFMEIGKFDLINNKSMGLNLLKKGASFHGVMLDSFIKLNHRTKRTLIKLVEQGFKNGSIKPITTNIFDKDQVGEAFRYMSTGKHIGKVLIKLQDEEKDETKLITALPKHHCAENSSYIIIGGLGGFGLELADWLVLRGVKNLVLSSRKGVTTGYQKYRLKTWKNYGVEIKISNSDVTTLKGCESLLEEALELGPVEGVFNLAVVLKDALLENQSVENFDISLGNKAEATKYMDVLTRRMCPGLKSVNKLIY